MSLRTSSTHTPLRIGVTGGIACGKTAASNVFRSLGITVIDADIIARKVVEPGSSLLPKLVEVFGSDILSEDGSLNRKRLRDIVFSDKKALSALNALIHPAIHAELEREANLASSVYTVLVIPLLFEHHLESFVDRILVLDVKEETQIKRVMERDGSSRAVAEEILKNQISREKRRELADDLIETDGLLLSELKELVLNLHKKYLQLAAKRN